MASLLHRGQTDEYIRVHYGQDYIDLIDALYEAIPQEEEDRLKLLTEGKELNGGTGRGWRDRGAAVCTYNNTIKNREEIVAWYRRARQLAGQDQRGEEEHSVETY